MSYCAFHGFSTKNVAADVIFPRNLLIQYVLLRIIVHYIFSVYTSILDQKVARKNYLCSNIFVQNLVKRSIADEFLCDKCFSAHIL